MKREVDTEVTAEHLGDVAERLVQRINPQAYAEYQLREAIAEALRRIGRENTQEIIDREMAA